MNVLHTSKQQGWIEGWIEWLGMLWVSGMMLSVLALWHEWILFQQAMHQQTTFVEDLHELEAAARVLLRQNQVTAQEHCAERTLNEHLYTYHYLPIGLYACIHRKINDEVWSTFHGWFELWRNDQPEYSLKLRVAWPYPWQPCLTGQYRTVQTFILSWNFIHHEAFDFKCASPRNSALVKPV